MNLCCINHDIYIYILQNILETLFSPKTNVNDRKNTHQFFILMHTQVWNILYEKVSVA